MTRQKDCKNRKAVSRATRYRSVSAQVERVVRELEAVNSDNPRPTDPIVEQLKECPEAFKAGEILGKILDSLKYSQLNDQAERYLPPAGAVLPPFV